MKTLMTSLFVAGTALMAAQTGTMPAPAANPSSPASTTTAPVKVKKHHKKAVKKDVAPANATTNAVPAAPAKK